MVLLPYFTSTAGGVEEVVLTWPQLGSSALGLRSLHLDWVENPANLERLLDAAPTTQVSCIAPHGSVLTLHP